MWMHDKTGPVTHVPPYLLNEGYNYRCWTRATQAASAGADVIRRVARCIGVFRSALRSAPVSGVGAPASSPGRPAGSAAPARIPLPWSSLACNIMDSKDLEMYWDFGKSRLSTHIERGFFCNLLFTRVSGPCFRVVGLLKNIILLDGSSACIEERI
jgi:hypothetical protein